MSWGPTSHPVIECAKCRRYVGSKDCTQTVEAEQPMGGMWAPNAWAVITHYEHAGCGGVTSLKDVRRKLDDAPDA